jgi:microcystin-dependent protein
MPITINGSGTINGVTEINNAIPPGSVIHVCTTSAPAGWLKANGADISRTAYANLFAAIGTTFGAGDGSTTFTLPDLRGEFVRSWADGRAVDTGRAFGTFQNYTTALPTVTAFGTSNPGNHSHDVYNIPYTSGSYEGGPYAAVDGRATFTSSGAGSHTHSITGGDSETRPRNIALLACIKF